MMYQAEHVCLVRVEFVSSLPRLAHDMDATAACAGSDLECVRVDAA